MAKKHKFGSVHTNEKLERLQSYLEAYSTALKNQRQWYKLVFFDAFAGTGDIQISEETPLLEGVDEYEPFIKGSASRALGLGHAFDRYIFVEKSRRRVRELEGLKAEYPELSDRIEVQNGDANEKLRAFCAETDWNKTRAVVFLDPFGNQVVWETVERIAETKAIDLWYLFPAGLGVYRQISKQGNIHNTHTASMDSLFGTDQWRNVFVKKRAVEDLFGSYEQSEKLATVDSVTDYMAGRMRGIFQGGVLDEWLPLGSRNIHMYSLMFAWANPSNNASALARRLANAVMQSGKYGRPK